MRKILIILLIVVFAGISETRASDLTLKDLSELIAAKYSDAVIVARIRGADLKFEVNNAALNQLRKDGASEGVLVALLEKSSSPAAAVSFGPETYERARSALREGDMATALDLLQGKERSGQLDGRERFLLCLVLVRQGDVDAAGKQVARLNASSSKVDKAFAARAEKFIADANTRRAGLHAAFELVANLQVRQAEYDLHNLELSQDARLAVNGQLLLLKGDIGAARKSFDQMAPTPTRRRLQDRSVEWQKTLARVAVPLKWYYSEASTTCLNTNPFHGSKKFPLPDIDFAEIGEIVDVLNALTPLASDTINKKFHWILTTGTYDELRTFGRMALASNGELRIPFVASDRRFNLVIDDVNKKLYVADVMMPAIIEYDDAQRSAQMSDSVLHKELRFDAINFSQIREIDQAARKSMLGPNIIQFAPIALKINRDLIIPEWLFMPWSHCLLGEVRQKQSTRNLAQFLIEVSGIKLVKSNLVEVKGSSGIVDAAVVTTLKAASVRQGIPVAGVPTAFDSPTYGAELNALFLRELKEIRLETAAQGRRADTLAGAQMENTIEDLVLIEAVMAL